MRFKYITIIILTIISILTVSSCCDCNKKKEKKPVITGKISWLEWQKLARWKDYDALDYNPSQEKIIELQLELKKYPNLKIMVFAGSWCEDSETGIPKIFKLLSMIGYEPNNSEFYGVDRDKNEPTGTSKAFGVEKVPTIIFFNNEQELGKIVEFPTISWEDDLLKIFGIANK